MIAFTAIAMGMRNAAVRKLAVPDLTTTVLTLTIMGLAADSSLARGTNPRLQRRIAAVVAMFAGAAVGSITLRHSVFMALAFSVVLQPRITDIVAVALRKKRRKGLEVVS
jgi:uncharacterized membrane protein YoaK (UPF0700 family)